MRFDSPLLPAKFLKRYKRFFADIELDGQVVTAHVPNTGSMKGCNTEGAMCLVSPAANPERKLRYTLEMIQAPDSWVGVNTSHPNKLVYELWETSPLEHWKKFDRAQLETKINKETRLDMALWSSKDLKAEKKGRLIDISPPLHFIEIKNVTLGGENRTAQFPDAVTERGQKHLHEMMLLMEKGYTCELVFVIQRQDCDSFSPADDIDPEYGKVLREAHKKGLIISPLVCELTAEEIRLTPRSLALQL